MNRTLRIAQVVVSFFLASAVSLVATLQAVAAAQPPINKEGGGEGAGDYMLSYLVVVLGIVLGLLVVAKTSNRRDRDRPAGYVEKNIMSDEK